VSLPQGTQMMKPLDPEMPAKKKPLLGRDAGSASVDTSAPLKKRVTSFLVSDAKRVLAAAR